MDEEAVSPQIWISHMKKEIDAPSQDDAMGFNKKQIMLVPKALNKMCPRAYTPHILSIGPLHARLTLSSMDHCKALCVNTFLGQCSSPFQLEQLTTTLFQGNKNPAADYFDIPNVYNEETLKVLIAIDYVVIIELICFLVARYMDTNVSHSCTSHIWNSLDKLTISQMQRDLFIVGNQVPLSNLVSLAKHRNLQEDDIGLVLWHMIWGWSPFSFENMKSPNFDLQKKFLTSEHLLDCLYKACVMDTDYRIQHKNIAPCYDVERLQPRHHIPRASKLHKFGVKFKGLNGNTSVIKYDKTKLIVQLPKLVIYDETEDMLRNLVAYEVNTQNNDMWDISAYVMLMDFLIDTSDDLEILYKAGVLENYLGSDEKLLDMWNNMCVNMQQPNNKRHDDMTQEIMIHYKTKWRKIYIEFRHRYFSKPWYFLSIVAAIFLLYMTVVQTIYTVLGYYKP